MRVKWNRNLDGFPLNSESSANSVSGSISGVSTLSSSHSFPGGSIMVIKTRRSSTSSSTTSSSKRNLFPMEDKKSLNKLSNILNLFKISKSDKSSSFSESSTPLMSRRKYNNDVTDSGYFSSSSGQLFTTDSKRRRRANNLLLRNSAVRRSWHQLCTQNQKQQLIVSSPPPTPLSYRSNRPSSPRSASPPYSLRSCKMFEDIAESDSLQQDSVDSNSAFSEFNENPANQANRSSPSETSYSLRSNGSNYSRDADSDFGRMKPHVPDLESRNDDPISQVAPKAWSSPYASSSTSSSTSPSLSSGEPYSSFINNRLNDSTAFQNRISVNVFVNTSGTLDNRDNKTSKNVLHNEVPDTGQSNTRESSFESTLTIPVLSHRPPSPSVNKSRSKAKDSAKDPWANELDKNAANQESVLNVAHSNGDRNLLIGPFNSSTTTTDEVVKVVVKKAMVPELVNLPATDCEVVMPLVKFDGDEPVTINGSSRDQGGNQSPGIQGILKDRSNGNGVHTALKSGIPKKVHFAETTRVKAKSYPVSNPQKGGKSPTLSNQDRTTVATSLTSTIGTTTTNTTSAATLTCPSFTEDSPEVVSLSYSTISTLSGV